MVGCDVPVLLYRQAQVRRIFTSILKIKKLLKLSGKAFQLNPDMQTEPGLKIDQYLADKKGWTLDYAQQMNAHVTEMAAQVGLTYHMDKGRLSPIALTRTALVHFAKQPRQRHRSRRSPV